MICSDCRKQIGPNAARHAHDNLVALEAEWDLGFRVQKFQALYRCNFCRTTLARGRNTGWTQPVTAVEVASATA